MLQIFPENNRHPDFFTPTGLSTVQAARPDGIRRTGRGFIVHVVPPFTPEDIAMISETTTSMEDPGFRVMLEYADIFKQRLGDKRFHAILAAAQSNRTDHRPPENNTAYKNDTR